MQQPPLELLSLDSPSWFVAASAVGFVLTAIVLGWTCPSSEQIEDWSTHYRKVAARAR